MPNINLTQTQQTALAQMERIDAQIRILRHAHSRLNLIASGQIETQQEIVAQAQAARNLILSADISRIND